MRKCNLRNPPRFVLLTTEPNGGGFLQPPVGSCLEQVFFVDRLPVVLLLLKLVLVLALAVLGMQLLGGGVLVCQALFFGGLRSLVEVLQNFRLLRKVWQSEHDYRACRAGRILEELVQVEAQICQPGAGVAEVPAGSRRSPLPSAAWFPFLR